MTASHIFWILKGHTEKELNSICLAEMNSLRHIFEPMHSSQDAFGSIFGIFLKCVANYLYSSLSPCCAEHDSFPSPTHCLSGKGVERVWNYYFLRRKKLTSAAALEAISMKSSNEISPLLHLETGHWCCNFPPNTENGGFCTSSTGPSRTAGCTREEWERASQVVMAPELISSHAYQRTCSTTPVKCLSQLFTEANDWSIAHTSSHISQHSCMGSAGDSKVSEGTHSFIHSILIN